VDTNGGASEVARVKTDKQGAFSISLNPGTYLLLPVLTDQEKFNSIVAPPQQFTVAAHQFTTVTVVYSQDLP
jgi:hypothetical protein